MYSYPMTDETENPVLELLRSMRGEIHDLRNEMRAGFAAIDKRFSKIEYNISVLADGSISLRNDIHILTIASAGHGERMAGIEYRLEQIESHFPSLKN